MYICIIYNFISSKTNQWVLLWDNGISEVQEFPFISKIPVGFETQLIETTKCIRTVINEMRGADIFIRADGEKNKSL
jgi:hypothetical protein